VKVAISQMLSQLRSSTPPPSKMARKANLQKPDASSKFWFPKAGSNDFGFGRVHAVCIIFEINCFLSQKVLTLNSHCGHQRVDARDKFGAKSKCLI
jgi:hypothetical protein